MSIFFDDVRWALRYARRRPAFAAAVVGTLTLAIAAATTALGAATAVLWRPLPFEAANQLVFVWEDIERDGQRHPSRVTGARYAAWRDAVSGLASLSLFGAAGFSVDTGDTRTTVRGVRVSAEYFETLGLRPLLGRTFRLDEDTPGNHRVVILSHVLWQERFGGRRDAVGGTLRLSGEPYTIVGVMPALTFPGWPVNPAVVTLEPDTRQFWVPIPRTPELEQSDRAHVFGVVARLGAATTAADLVERLNRTATDGAVDPHGTRLLPLREQFVADARTPLLTLAAAALVVLLIACADLAALYAAAFEARRVELAVRAALGAGVPRLVRQLALETSTLALVSTTAGLLIASAALARIPTLLPPSFPFLTAPELDLRVGLLALAVTSVACAVIAGWPVARLIADPSPRGVTAPTRPLVYRVLVVAQIAGAFALVVAANLLGQSLRSVQRQDAGFAIDRVLIADIGLPARPGTDAARVAREEQLLLAAIAARPAVRAVATAYDHPLEANWSESPAISGNAGAPDERRQLELRIVSPGYFEAIDIELLDGRTFTNRDAIGAPGVAVVNEALARELGGSVIGRRVVTGTPRFSYGADMPNEFEIVGVVENERFRGLEQSALPAFYLTTRQFPQTSFSLIVRTHGEPMAAASEVRAAIGSVDPAVTVTRATSLEAILADQLAARRVTTNLVAGFGTTALALAALGMYGLLAVVVGSRAREIGIRLAIGGSPIAVARQVVADSLFNASMGIVVGLGFALGTGRLLERLLVGVSPRDPFTLGGVAALLVAVALVTALVPAWRAARVDPMIALRVEP